MDTIAKHIAHRGRGTLLAKLDLKSAYRMVPIHPEDRPLLGMKWRGKTYNIDKVLPFGLCSAPIIFTALADALQWLIKQEGVDFLEHYLDDYVTMGEAGTGGACQEMCKPWKGSVAKQAPLLKGRRERALPPVSAWS